MPGNIHVENKVKKMSINNAKLNGHLGVRLDIEYPIGYTNPVKYPTRYQINTGFCAEYPVRSNTRYPSDT